MKTTISTDPPDLYVAFDTETTGLSPVNDRVVEIAAVAFRPDGTEIASFERLVNPGLPIPADMTAIHGITDEMVAGQPGVEQALPEFVRFIGGAVLVAHNAPYDVAMLMVPLVSLTSLAPPDNLVLDTCALARAAFPGAPNYRLGTIADLLGIPRGRAHRALPDVLACKEVFLRTLGKIGSAVSIQALVRLNGSELRFGPNVELLDGSRSRDSLLADALSRGTPITIEYQGGTKGSSPRLVTPITLLAQVDATYLVAHCHLDGSLKHFRLDRITRIESIPREPQASAL